ncbi:MAG TPA: type III secretion system cytoplasmic ring protein SctQ [Saliniramus sp.]|nr:type III secretion system cytoplasmic ring protein SctQ [Saliniramus sp.]
MSVAPHAASPLELPHLTNAQAITARNLSRRRAPFQLQTEIGDVALRLAGQDALSSWAGSWCRLDLLCADRRATLWLPNDLVDAIIQGNHPDIDPGTLEPTDRALIVDAIENDLIDRLSHAARAEIAIIAATATEEIDEPVDLVFHAQPKAGGQPIPAGIRCHEVERDRIVAAILAAPLMRVPVPGLKTEIAFRCGHTTISLTEFSELEVGCGISLDDTTLSFQKIVAVVAERFVQSCNWQTVKPVLDGPLLQEAGPTTLYYTANALVTDQPKNAPQSGPTASVGEVPVHLVFELGRTEVAVADLETLQAGYVFDLGKPLSQSVEILANGHRVGTGELVRLGETIGVRVSRLVR